MGTILKGMKPCESFLSCEIQLHSRCMAASSKQG